MKKNRDKAFSVKRIATNAVLIAIYIAISMLAFNMGPFKLTFEAFPVIVCAVIFGPVDAMLVGGIAELINQLFTFGVTPTTILWILPILIRGFMIGIFSKVWKKKNTVVFLVICIVAAVVHSLLNTLALYVDSKMFGYYTEALVFGALFVRVLASVITATIMAIATKVVVQALKKSNLI